MSLMLDKPFGLASPACHSCTLYCFVNLQLMVQPEPTASLLTPSPVLQVDGPRMPWAERGSRSRGWTRALQISPLITALIPLLPF